MNDLPSIRWIPIGGEDAAAGDLVSGEAGGLPVYRIVRIDNGDAWLARADRDQLEKHSLQRFHWKAARPN